MDYSIGRNAVETNNMDRLWHLNKSIELGLVDEIDQDNQTLQLLAQDPSVKNKFNLKSGSLPNIFKTSELMKEQGKTVTAQGSQNNGTSIATVMGRADFYVPKVSKKIHLKESLPSYQREIKGLFKEEDQK